MSLQIEAQPFQFNNTVTGLSSAVFNSVSATSLSGIFFGDGSNLNVVVSVSGTPSQINASKSGSTVTLSLPNSATFPGDVSIIGNLTIAGSATYIDTKNLVVGDNIIYFNDNNYGSNVLDMGIVSHLTQAPLGYNHTGLIRRAGEGVPGVWTLFSGLTTEPASAANIDWNDKNIKLDSLSANLIGNVTGNASTVTNGVYTNQSYSNPTWITSIPDTILSGSKFATNTTLQSTSALLTPLTTTNTLTSQLVLNSTLNSLSGNWQSAYITVSSLSANWNSAYNIATIYQSASGSFATNTLLQSTSALLTPLTLTNTLTSQLANRLSSYLPLTGGTLTNSLTISAATNHIILRDSGGSFNGNPATIRAIATPNSNNDRISFNLANQNAVLFDIRGGSNPVITTSSVGGNNGDSNQWNSAYASTTALNLGLLLAHTSQSSLAIDTIPRMMASVTSQLASGTVYFTMFSPLYDITVSQITVSSGTASAPSGATMIKFGLYTFVESSKLATLVAKTANDTTLLATGNTIYTKPFDTTGGYPASYTLKAGQRYAFASIAIATTTPNMFGMYPGSNLAQLTPIMSKLLAGQSDLPTSATLSTAGGQTYFGRFS